MAERVSASPVFPGVSHRPPLPQETRKIAAILLPSSCIVRDCSPQSTHRTWFGAWIEKLLNHSIHTLGSQKWRGKFIGSHR